jgi:hypothetical protein
MVAIHDESASSGDISPIQRDEDVGKPLHRTKVVLNFDTRLICRIMQGVPFHDTALRDDGQDGIRNTACLPVRANLDPRSVV